MAGFDQTTDSMDFMDSEFWTGKYRSGPRFEKLRIIEAECKVVPTDCPSCGKKRALRPFAKLRNDNPHTDSDRPKILEYRHSPEDEWHRVVRLKQRLRLRCGNCEATVLQPLPGMDSRRQMTDECVRYILARSKNASNLQIAKAVGIAEKTVRLVIRDHQPARKAKVRVPAPKFLCISEVRIEGKLRTVYADLDESRIMHIDENRRKKELIRWLSHLSECPKRIQFDGRAKHYEAIRQVFGNLVPVALDHAPLIRLLDRSVLKIEARAVRYPRGTGNARARLAEDARSARHRFLALYRLRSVSDMRAGLRSWRASLSPELKQAFDEPLAIIAEWRNELLAIFDKGFPRSHTHRMASLLRGVSDVSKNWAGADRSFQRVKALVREGGIRHPGQRAHRCRRCEGLLPANPITRKFPHPLEALTPTMAEILVETCDECLKPNLRDWEDFDLIDVFQR